MKFELLLFIKRHTDTLTEQTKTKPQEMFEFKLNKQRRTFSLNPPKNVSEKSNRFLAETSFEATNSVLHITFENNTFSISTPGQSILEGSEDFVERLSNLLKLTFENAIELHIKQLEKSCRVLVMLGHDPNNPIISKNNWR